MKEVPRQDPGERGSVLSYLPEVERFAGRPAYRWREGVRSRARTWGEMRERAGAAAASLAAAGAGPGDRVLIQGANGPDWVEALLGCFLLRAVAVPLDEETGPEFREKVAGRSEARFMLAPESVEPPPGVERLVLGTWGSAIFESSDEPGAGDTAEIVFTSGTTGDPKGVVLTHGNLMAALRGIERGYRKRRRERWLDLLAPLPFVSTLPLSHMFGQALSVFLPVMMGLTVVFAPPRPREAREAVRRSKAWGLFCVPRLMDLLARDLRRELREAGREAAFDARHDRWRGRPRWLQALAHRAVQRRFGWRFRAFVVGGAPMPPDLRRFWDEMGYLVVVGYGLTETAPIVSVSNPFERGADSVGRPGRAQEVRIGPDGEVLVRGANVTPGYLGDETGEAFEDGWFRTGDVGTLDERGRLHIRGRLKEVIVTPEGENVHARDVEEVLEAQVGVREAAVIGLAVGEGAGERVHAVLLMEEGADAAGVVAAANARLPAKARIRSHTLWPEADFPRTATGKARKPALRAAVEAMQAGGNAAQVLESGAGEVRAMVAALAGVPPGDIQEDTRLAEGLGLGSLDLVELAAQMEEAFGASIAEETLQQATIADLERLAKEAGGGVTISADAAAEAPAAPSRPGALRMPRWARRWPVHILRRVLEEVLVFPFVKIYARPRTEGLEHLDGLDHPFLLVANHHSHMDTGILKAVLPWRLRGRIAPGMTTRHMRLVYGEIDGPRSTYLKQWVERGILELFFHVWPLPETAGFRHSLRYAGELADDGYSLLLFPQGRLQPEGEEGPFREGTGIFARDLRLPVVPAWVEGTGPILPPGARWPRFGRTRARFGPPLRIDPGEDPAAIARRLEEAVMRLGGRPRD